MNQFSPHFDSTLVATLIEWISGKVCLPDSTSISKLGKSSFKVCMRVWLWSSLHEIGFDAVIAFDQNSSTGRACV